MKVKIVGIANEIKGLASSIDGMPDTRPFHLAKELGRLNATCGQMFDAINEYINQLDEALKSTTK